MIGEAWLAECLDRAGELLSGDADYGHDKVMCSLMQAEPQLEAAADVLGILQHQYGVRFVQLLGAGFTPQGKPAVKMLGEDRVRSVCGHQVSATASDA